MTLFLMLFGLFALIFINVPIAVALAVVAVVAMLLTQGVDILPNVALVMFDGATKFPLLAIPFFVMMGSVMNYSGISNKLMQMAEVLTGHMVGGLAQVNVLLSTMMGGVSGSANADAAMQSKILVPQMEARGYSRAFSSAITAASSAIAPVISSGAS